MPSITVPTSPTPPSNSTTTTLTASPNPSTLGQSVALDATVAATTGYGGAIPFGVVTFEYGSTVLGTANLDGVPGNDQAILNTTALPIGTDTLEAIYGGDSNNAGSNGTTTQVVNPLAADHIGFIQQPTNTIAGQFINPIEIGVYNSAGNLVTSDNSTVTLALGNNGNTGVLNGTLSVQVSAGIATFSNLTINQSGTGYTLQATDGSLAGATSNSFNITPAAATQLILAAPSTVTAGSAFDVTVTAEDQFGNIATDYLGTVHFMSSDTAAGVILPSDYAFQPGDQGTHTFGGTVLQTPGNQTITATDTVTSSISGSGSVLVISNTVQLPALTPIPSQTVNENALLTFAVTATGTGPITYSLVNPLPGMAIDPHTGQFTWVPDCNQIGNWTATVSASNSAGSVRENVSISVLPLTAQQELAGTIAQMNGLVAAHVLSSAQATPLLANLAAAQVSLAADDAPPAVQQLAAFQTGVLSLVESGALSSAAAATLSVPSIVYWTGQGDGFSWNNPLNWNNDQLPTPCDDVYIRATPGLVIEHPAGNVAIHSLHSYNPINFTGSLTLATNSEVHKAFDFNGTLEQLDGPLNFSGGGNIGGTLDTGTPTALFYFSKGQYVDQGTIYGGDGTTQIGSAQGGELVAYHIPKGQPNTGLSFPAYGSSVHRDNVLLFAPGSITGGGEYVQAAGSLTWTNGKMTGEGTTQINFGASLSIQGNGTKLLQQRTLVNYGLTSATGGTLSVDDGATITNKLPGFLILGNVSITQDKGAPGSLMNDSFVVQKAGTATTDRCAQSATFDTIRG